MPAQPPSSDPKRAPAKAPASSMPSIAILITATRSHRMPPSAASAMGTARTTVACSMPVSEIDLPAVAHTRKAMARMTRPIPRDNPVHRPPPRRNSLVPRNARMIAAIRLKSWLGNTRLPTAQLSRGREILNVETLSHGASRKNMITAASNTSAKPLMMRRLSIMTAGAVPLVTAASADDPAGFVRSAMICPLFRLGGEQERQGALHQQRRSDKDDDQCLNNADHVD